jgi:hypothetical protein
MSFDTQFVLQMSGLNRKELERFLSHGFRPAKRGRAGRWYPHQFDILDIVALRYGATLITAGCHPSWAWMAAAWVADQNPGYLLVQFELGNTHVVPQPAGACYMATPQLPPEASRQVRLIYSQMSLKRVYHETINDMLSVLDAGDAELLRASFAKSREMAAEVVRRRAARAAKRPSR